MFCRCIFLNLPSNYRKFLYFFKMVLELTNAIFLASFNLQHEGSDAADKTEREAMHRSHSQLPYFLGRPAQDHTVIKSGYCVKQGAVVSTCCSVGSLLTWFHFCFLALLREHLQCNRNGPFITIANRQL